MSRGLFLVLEGPEGAGKSTLALALARRAQQHGHEVVSVREPGGTPAAEAAREILLARAHPVGPEAELFLVLAARADLIRRIVRPALEAGKLVIGDRYELSTWAYQVIGRGLPATEVAAANTLATGGLSADLTLVLDLPPSVGRARQLQGGKQTDRLDDEDAAFHARVGAAYLSAAGPGVHHLDAAASPDAVLGHAWAILAERWRQA